MHHILEIEGQEPQECDYDPYDLNGISIHDLAPEQEEDIFDDHEYGDYDDPWDEEYENLFRWSE